MAVLDDLKAQGSLSGCVLKIGEVSAIDPSSCKARVVFDDEDSMTTDLLPVVQRNTLNNKDYWMPAVGEDVLVFFTGESAETGFILGSWYAGEITPPDSSESIRSVQFEDGAKFTYDKSGSKLTIKIGGTTIEVDGSNVKITPPSTAEVSAETVNVNGSAAVNISAPTVTLTMGSTTMTLNGSRATIKSDDLVFEGKMTVTGDLEVQGNVNTTGNITASGTISGSNI